MLKPDDRIAILMHKGLKGAKGKTGISMLRYSQNPIVAVIDEEAIGDSIVTLTNIDRDVPIAGIQAHSTRNWPCPFWRHFTRALVCRS